VNDWASQNRIKRQYPGKGRARGTGNHYPNFSKRTCTPYSNFKTFLRGYWVKRPQPGEGEGVRGQGKKGNNRRRKRSRKKKRTRIAAPCRTIMAILTKKGELTTFGTLGEIMLKIERKTKKEGDKKANKSGRTGGTFTKILKVRKREKGELHRPASRRGGRGRKVLSAHPEIMEYDRARRTDHQSGGEKA